MNLRPAQKQILKYQGGRVAINAVPGSGKTFTLAMLAAQIIRDGLIDLELGQTVLVVTYLNASVDAFRATIRQRLNELNLPEMGFEVKTLHSLSLEIYRQVDGSLRDIENDFVIADDFLSRQALDQALDGSLISKLETSFGSMNIGREMSAVHLRDYLVKTASEFIGTAKNHRYSPTAIMSALANMQSRQMSNGEVTSVAALPSLSEMAEIYQRYQSALNRINALDFDDIIWKAVNLLEARADAVEAYRKRWPYVLEDEAQDSVPLQEQLLSALTGPDGNWVRAGDPNQSITSSFTSSDPRQFSSYAASPEVESLPLPNSGRSAAKIYRLANELVRWVSEEHPVEEVRTNTFFSQRITPTPPGDSQPNPPDSESLVKIKVYRDRHEDELRGVAHKAVKLTREMPAYTVAILTPTNHLGRQIGNHLRQLGVEFDDLLRGGGLFRQVAGTLQAFISLLANPQRTKSLEAVFSALVTVNHPITANARNPKRISAILRSIGALELFLFPQEKQHWTSALPEGVAVEEEIRFLNTFSSFLLRVFEMRHLPVEDLVLSLCDVIFGTRVIEPDRTYDQELAIAFQIANEMRLRLDVSSGWRLTELAIELENLAVGRRLLPGVSQKGFLFKPEPGRITLVTQHSAKGMEWDAVFLVGIDAKWIPGDLTGQFRGEVEAFGGDPIAEIKASLLRVIQGSNDLYPGRTATEAAHIDLISERLRLLYVGITRARRILHISRSQFVQQNNQEIHAQPALVMEPLYKFIQRNNAQHLESPA